MIQMMRNDQQTLGKSPSFTSPGDQGPNQEQEANHVSSQSYAQDLQQSCEGLDMFIGSLEPHQWLSPSTMNWGEWDAAMPNVL